MGRGVRPLYLGDQDFNQAMLLQRQQQNLYSRQSSQAAAAQINFLQQQRILQLQQQEHQELLKTLPQKEFQQRNFPIRSAMRPVYESGTCARLLTQYIYQQQCRPADNNIDFWRKFVTEFFTPNAKKKCCVSWYANSRQMSDVFPKDVWHCEICGCKPCHGFETTVEVLPRLFKIKYDSGTLQELLYVDMPHEYENTSGQIVLDCAKAIQESVFEDFRVVRDGQLRLIFSRDLKICSWEFCTRYHEELIPQRIVVPQLNQIGSAAQKYQVSAQNVSTNLSAEDLQSNCNMFVASTHQLAKALELPLVNDLGYSKRYVRCLQIADVVNIMKDLIDYSRETGNGPMESLANFTCGARSLSGLHNMAMKTEWQQLQQQIMGPNLVKEHSLQGTAMPPSTSTSVASGSNSVSSTSTLTSDSTVAWLLHENSLNPQHENEMNNRRSSCAGTPFQIPSAVSSTTRPPAQLNPSSSFLSPTHASSNNPPKFSYDILTSSAATNHINSLNSAAESLQRSAQSKEANHEFQNSVEQILQEL